MVNYGSIYDDNEVNINNPNDSFYMTNRYNRIQLEKSKKKRERCLRFSCCSLFIAINGLSFYLGNKFGYHLF